MFQLLGERQYFGAHKHPRFETVQPDALSLLNLKPYL